jgi:Mimiviridae putative poly(A) polymerase catalytic subunit
MSMSLFRESDIEDLDNKIDDIVKAADKERYQKVRPTLDQMWEMIYTVLDYVSEKKRKIYGGFALNKLVETVAPEDKFYDDDNVEDWDIDFYSPDPIGDAREIANRLHDKGFEFVNVSEALHDETYKIFAENMDVADISYVPRNIYNRMPFKDIEIKQSGTRGMQTKTIYLAGAHFMMIDYFRVITDPLTSYFRLDKTVTRLNIMDRHFPLPHNTSSLNIEPAEDELDIAFRTIHEFFTNRESTIVLGTYAYNQLVKESGVQDRKLGGGKSKKERKISRGRDNSPQKQTEVKIIPVNYYEAISTEYKKDARALILKLREKFLDDGKLVTHEESYPFFQYLGYSVTIYYEEDVICKLYHYNHRCTPYHTVPAYYFGKGTADMASDGKKDDKIQIGSYPMIILYNLVAIMKARVDNDHHTKNLYYTLNSHMIEMKSWYFNNSNKTMYDDTLFKDFVLQCRGNMLTPKRERQLRIERRKAAGKRYVFRYMPANEGDRNAEIRYRFNNSSGNPIRNDSNHQIDLTAEEINIKDDVESDISSEQEDDNEEEHQQAREPVKNTKTTKVVDEYPDEIMFE